MNQKTYIVIPARYKSSRFPGKPLSDICGKKLIQRVWDVCIEAAEELGIKVIVATDDLRIESFCISNHIAVVMTSEDCLTGTDRIYEVHKKLQGEAYINVQGDEPLISKEDIYRVFERGQLLKSVVFGQCPIKTSTDFESKAVPKVVSDQNGRVLYLSRAAIPSSKENGLTKAWKQVCIYYIPALELELFGETTEKTELELLEDIEVLRFLELGRAVHVVDVVGGTIAVDYPEDITRVEEVLRNRASQN